MQRKLIMMVSQSMILKKIKMRSNKNQLIRTINIIIEQEAEEEVSTDITMLTKIENLRRVTLKTIRTITLEEEVEVGQVEREDTEETFSIEIEATISIEEIISIENESQNRSLKKPLCLTISQLSKTHIRKKNRISKKKSQNKTLEQSKRK